MSRLDRARARLAENYRLGLIAKAEALAAERRLLDDRNADAIDAVRRMAHQLRGSGSSFGFPEITEAATVVEDASTDRLPAALDTLTALLQTTGANGPATDKVFILLIEDDHELAGLVERHLCAQDREILHAATIEEARACLAAMPVDLIILDLTLPDGDGRNLLAELQDQPKTADLPVVVLSATSAAQTKTECLALGAEQFLEKPIEQELLSATVSGILQRRRRHSNEVRIDTLTGLTNRAGFREEYERAIKLSGRAGLPLALAMLDLDRFKALNDTYGHQAGDAVLRQIAALFADSLRQTDVPARWGGEEFVVLFQNTKAVIASDVLRKLQNLLGATQLTDGGVDLPATTFSAGVVDVDLRADIDHELARADKLLYHAKDSGRNCVLDAAPEPGDEAKTHILLAEDDHDMARLVRASLEAEGFLVSHYADGQSALTAALASSPQLVILDKVMPEVDGFEVLRRMRSEAADRTVPVVMLTAAGRDDEIERAFDLGADDYLQKPFRPRELVARVRRLLRR